MLDKEQLQQIIAEYKSSLCMLNDDLSVATTPQEQSKIVEHAAICSDLLQEAQEELAALEQNDGDA